MLTWFSDQGAAQAIGQRSKIRNQVDAGRSVFNEPPHPICAPKPGLSIETGPCIWYETGNMTGGFCHRFGT